jgi:hypothetical protein
VVSFVFIANLCVICARVKRGEPGLWLDAACWWWCLHY